LNGYSRVGRKPLIRKGPLKTNEGKEKRAMKSGSGKRQSLKIHKRTV